MSVDKTLEEFEDWHQGLIRKLISSDEVFAAKSAANMKDALLASWISSRAGLVIELPGSVGFDGYPDGPLLRLEAVVTAIESAGLKVKS